MGRGNDSETGPITPTKTESSQEKQDDSEGTEDFSKIRKEVLRTKVNLEDDTEEELKAPAPESALQAEARAKKMSQSIENVFHNVLTDDENRHLWKIQETSRAISGNEKYGNVTVGNTEDAAALDINAQVRRGEMLAYVSDAIAEEAGNDLLLAEKLEDLLNDYQQLLFEIEKEIRFSNYGNWKLKVSEKNLERFLRAVERKTSLHKQGLL